MHEHLLWFGLSLLGCKFQLRERTQQVVRLAVGRLHIDRKVAVQGMRDLVDVVADTPKGGEQGRVHRRVARRYLDLSIADEAFAEP